MSGRKKSTEPESHLHLGAPDTKAAAHERLSSRKAIAHGLLVHPQIFSRSDMTAVPHPGVNSFAQSGRLRCRGRQGSQRPVDEILGEARITQQEQVEHHIGVANR
jgi:hypothetical protein